MKTLRFDDRPDYEYLKRLFRELFYRKGLTYDSMFDWEVLDAGATNGRVVIGENIEGGEP